SAAARSASSVSTRRQASRARSGRRWLSTSPPACCRCRPPAGRGPMPTALDTRQLVNLLAALLIGALVGIEREKNKAASGNVGIGGVRTFILFSLTGAFGALVAQAVRRPLLLAAALAGGAALPRAGCVL